MKKFFKKFATVFLAVAMMITTMAPVQEVAAETQNLLTPNQLETRLWLTSGDDVSAANAKALFRTWNATLASGINGSDTFTGTVTFTIYSGIGNPETGAGVDLYAVYTEGYVPNSSNGDHKIVITIDVTSKKISDIQNYINTKLYLRLGMGSAYATSTVKNFVDGGDFDMTVSGYGTASITYEGTITPAVAAPTITGVNTSEHNILVSGSISDNFEVGYTSSSDNTNNYTTFANGTYSEFLANTEYKVAMRYKNGSVTSAWSTPVTVRTQKSVSDSYTITYTESNGQVVGNLTGLDTTYPMEYSTDGGLKFSRVVDGKLENLPLGYVVWLRYAERQVSTNKILASSGQKYKPKAATSAKPTASDFTVTNVTTHGGNDGAITGILDTMEYSTNGGTSWTQGPASPTTLSAGSVLVRYKETADNAPSLSVTLTVKEPAAAPDASSFTITNASAFGKNDGKIAGVNNTMEYSADGVNYTPIIGSSIENLAAGTYKIRYKAASGVAASEPVDVTVKQPVKTPSASANYTSEKLTGLTANQTYQVSIGGQIKSLTADSKGEIPLTTSDYDMIGKEVKIVQPAPADGSALASAAQTITINSRNQEEPKAAELTGKTATTVTVSASEGQEYSIDGGNTWISGNEKGLVTFTGLDKDSTYTVVTRMKATSNSAASYPWAETEVSTNRYDAKDIAGFFHDSQVTSTGEGLTEKADNDAVTVTVDESGNYQVSLKSNIDGTVEIPDDLGKLGIDLNGYTIQGNDGTAESPEGKPGILVSKTGKTDNPSEIALTDSKGTGKVIGGNGFDGSGAAGGSGIAASDLASGTKVTVGEGVTVLGGNGADSKDAKVPGGNGGAGIKSDADIIVDGGMIYGGNGGNGANVTDGNGGTGGNGGAGIDGKATFVTGTKGTANGGNAGNGGNSENGNGGTGGNGGNTVDGDVIGSNFGDAGNGGNGGDSKNGNGGIGGNGGEATDGNGGNGGNGGASVNGNGGIAGNGGKSVNGNAGTAGEAGKGRSLKESDFKVTDPSKVGASDGKISGVDSTMEYSLDGGNTWIKVTDSEITGLKAGTVLIRVAATDTTVAGEALEITLTDPEKKTGNTGKDETGKTDKTASKVNTGDENVMLSIYLMMALLSSAGILLYTKRRYEK